MTAGPQPTSTRPALHVALVLARWIVGLMFIYMGLNKALHPVEFLKLVRQYDMVHAPLVLNLIATILPWFEVFCGLLLVLGIAVRGSALMLVGMLVPFTLIVLRRAIAIHDAGGIAFCAIKFDCGCGTGEVFICRKLVENTLLTLFSAALLRWRSRKLCLRYAVIGDR
ncbi:MAG: DoxX family membrane protein [Verrucomicrobia bacterium]|nr:DoxX family membrane protein [Verrucomicrobiota bacterium]